MYNKYFEDCEVKSIYKKEFISLWPEWLGKENYHKLDEVTENESKRFHSLIKSIANQYDIELADYDSKSILKIDNIEELLSHKDSEKFLTFIIPNLDCIISEEWDYTYILWHKNNGALEIISPIIDKEELCHFDN